MPLSRWHYPFKTEQERKLVALWFKKNKQAEKQEQLKELGAAPF
jgi:hypothetical protein